MPAESPVDGSAARWLHDFVPIRAKIKPDDPQEPDAMPISRRRIPPGNMPSPRRRPRPAAIAARRAMPPSTRRRGAATSPHGRDRFRARQPPWNEALGPVRPRGGPNGLVLRGGRIVAEWGDTAPGRPDLQRRQELSVDPRRARLRPRHDPRPARAGAPHSSTMAGSSRRTTTRSPGIICCSRPRNGRGRCGTSPT